MCIRDSLYTGIANGDTETANEFDLLSKINSCNVKSKSVMAYKNKDKTFAIKCPQCGEAVSYTHLRAHETVLDLVCRLLLEKKNTHKLRSH